MKYFKCAMYWKSQFSQFTTLENNLIKNVVRKNKCLKVQKKSKNSLLHTWCKSAGNNTQTGAAVFYQVFSFWRMIYD